MQRTATCITRQSSIFFSGIQPTGVPHLGNFVGALQQWVKLQQHLDTNSKLIFSIVDLHALSSLRKPLNLRDERRRTLAALLAVGIDPNKSVIFYQSSVASHSELMWILSCAASIGYLSRMTSWKMMLRSSQISHDAGGLPIGSQLKLGLFSYPVLQAADILVHRATHVPVGPDQQQHLEFARECVTKFNSFYGHHLIQPETLTSPIHRIMSLTEPTRKMSKSHPNEHSRILLTDTAEDIREKISAAVTDSYPGIDFDQIKRPGLSNLLNILSVLDVQRRSPKQIAEELRHTSISQIKNLVGNSIIRKFSGVRERYLELINPHNASYLDEIEVKGSRKAQESAKQTMNIIRDAIGL